MSETWNIYRAGTDEVIAVVHELEYHGEWMGDEFVTVSVKSPVPVEWHFGDNLAYRGEAFTINYDPNVVKKARRETYGEGFVYDNIKFYSDAAGLKVIDFKDIVLADNMLPYTSLSQFSFYAGSVEDLADRLQANLNRIETGWNVFTPNRLRTYQRVSVTAVSQWDSYYTHISGDNVTVGEIDVNIDVADGESCWDVLKYAYTKFQVPYYVRGKNIIIGGDSLQADHIFRYGKGNGLYEVERTTDESQAVITKLYAYGSEKNIPLNYYANLHKSAYVNGFRGTMEIIAGHIEFVIDTEIEQSKVIKAFSKNDQCVVECNGHTINAHRTISRSVFDGNGNMLHDYLRISLGEDADAEAFWDAMGTGTVKVFITDGVNINLWPQAYIATPPSYDYPMLLSINKLMLPGFPDISLKEWVCDQADIDDATIIGRTGPESISDVPDLPDTSANREKNQWRARLRNYGFSTDKHDPWIISANLPELGLREGLVNFDGSSDNEEIFPTIEGTGYDEVSWAQQMDDNGYLDEDAPEESLVFEFMPSGDPNGIDWTDNDGNLTFSMKDGACVGREFKVDTESIERNENTGLWEMRLERTKDDSLGRFFPYKELGSSKLYQVMGSGNHQGQMAGDHFVALGLYLQQSFVDAAAKKLLLLALEYLDIYDHPRPTYVPKIDEIYMQRQHDYIVSRGTGQSATYGTTSYHDILHAGMQFEFADTDLNIHKVMSIDQLSIKEKGNNGIPTYSVVLREEKDEGTLSSMSSRISDVEKAVGQQSTDSNTSLNRLYLRKDSPDEAAGVIAFLQGILFGDGKNGITEEGVATLEALKSSNFLADLLSGTGFGIWKDEDGVSTAEFDKLNVRMKAVFAELEIKKRTYSGGNIIFSDAGNKLVLVLPMDANGVVKKDESGNLVWENAVAYRCCWYVEDGDEAVSNDWWIGDQARCQTFNLKAGVYQNVSNRYYWRKVLNAGEFEYEDKPYNYIDLAAGVTGTYKGEAFVKGCQTGVTNDIPKAGDSCVQVGHQNDANPERQNIIEIVVNGDNAPAILKYQGINDYTFDDKLIQGDYYDTVSHTFKTVTYGDWYVGDKSGEGGYASYDTATNTLNIKGKLQVGAVLDDGRDVNDLGLTKGNLLRNSGFTGQYESEPVSASMTVDVDAVIYSDPFDSWTQSGCTSVTESLSASGMAAIIGTLKQTIEGGLVVGDWYTFSFRGKGGVVTVTVGGVTKDFELTSTLTRYDWSFECESNTPFIMSGNGSEVTELQLMAGNIPSEWHANAKDNDASLAAYYADDYLRKAIFQASTTINGGLIMTQIIKVGNYRDGYMTTETGGMSGAYNDGRSPFLWGGGTMSQAIYAIMKYANNPAYQPTETEVANMAKFVVTHGGRAILNDIILRGYIYAIGGVFNGTVYAKEGRFSGFVGKSKTIITEQNASQYIGTIGYWGDRVLDIKKSGSWVEFRSLNQGFTVMLPCLYASVTTYSQAEIEEVRSLVGNIVILHNMSNTDISVTGNNKMSHDGSGVSFSLQPGKIATLTCCLGDVDGYEDIYWLYGYGTSHEAMQSSSS